jgi:hypothetical protein
MHKNTYGCKQFRMTYDSGLRDNPARFENASKGFNNLIFK